MNRLEKHIEKILNQMQSDVEERTEIKEEMLSHLSSLKEQYEEDGHSSKQAEKKALEEFGDAGLVGNGLQETMYPYQRSLLYVIGLATIALGVFLHFAFLATFNEPSLGWLAIQLTFGTLVTLVAMNISLLGRFYWSVNSLVFLNGGWNGFSYFAVVQFPQIQTMLFTIYLAILILTCLTFIIRNSYFYSIDETSDKRNRRLKKVSHIVNIIAGAMICGVAIFFVYGFIVMAGISWFVLIPIGVVIGWLLFYKLLIKLIARKPVASMIPALIVIVTVHRGYTETISTLGGIDMELLYSYWEWGLIAGLLSLHVILLFFRKEKVALIASRLMIGAGGIALVAGLLFYLRLGIYGVVVLLLGFVLYLTTKDLMQGR